MARHLLLTLGEERLGAPRRSRREPQAIAEWKPRTRTRFHGVDIDNGSGLSRITHISVLQMAQTLSAAYHSRLRRNSWPRFRWPASTAHCGRA